MLENGWLAAAGVSVAALWQNLKNLFQYLVSFVVVTVEIWDTATSMAVSRCLITEFTPVRAGNRLFGAQNLYVRPLKKVLPVVGERMGHSMIFRKGLCLLIASYGDDDKNNRPRTLKLTYLRGTLDAERLLLDACDRYSDQFNFRTRESRYRIVRISGEGFRRRGSGDEIETSPDSEREFIRYLKWRDEEVGAPIPREPFGLLHYSPEIMRMIDEINHWLTAKEWYEAKGIPWRFSALLEGPPGTGKSSFVRAVAQTLGLPVWMIDLSDLSNAELVQHWKKALVSAPVVILLEDIDRHFKDESIQQPSFDPRELSRLPEEERERWWSRFSGGVTLDCLLNLIQGVEESDGILLFFTANDASRLDIALGIKTETGRASRPGRIDQIISFGTLTTEAKVRIAGRILSEWPELAGEAVTTPGCDTGAQFVHLCTQMALQRFWDRQRKAG